MKIIRSHNTPNRVTLVDGTEIERDKSEKIWIPKWGAYVKCAPYLPHFIFEVPQRIQGPAHMCSCGGEAVIVGSKAFKHLSSLDEPLLVCQHHTMSNKHSDGSS